MNKNECFHQFKLYKCNLIVLLYVLQICAEECKWLLKLSIRSSLFLLVVYTAIWNLICSEIHEVLLLLEFFHQHQDLNVKGKQVKVHGRSGKSG